MLLERSLLAGSVVDHLSSVESAGQTVVDQDYSSTSTTLNHTWEEGNRGMRQIDLNRTIRAIFILMVTTGCGKELGGILPGDAIVFRADTDYANTGATRT